MNYLTISPESHVDHNLSAEQIAWAIEQAPDACPFFIKEVEMPEVLGTAPCALRGPASGDAPIDDAAIYWRIRGNRLGASRMVAMSQVQSRKLVIIGGTHEGAFILYTAYAGPLAPREPFEAGLTDEQKAESSAFWAQHALAE